SDHYAADHAAENAFVRTPTSTTTPRPARSPAPRDSVAPTSATDRDTSVAEREERRLPTAGVIPSAAAPTTREVGRDATALASGSPTATSEVGRDLTVLPSSSPTATSDVGPNGPSTSVLPPPSPTSVPPILSLPASQLREEAALLRAADRAVRNGDGT